MTIERFEKQIDILNSACREFYGERLVSLAVFGSVGRGVPKPDSDIDLLIIAENLPAGRVSRVGEFTAIEKTMRDRMNEGLRLQNELSPVLKTPEEVQRGSLLFLDMIDDARILFDRDDFIGNFLKEFKARLDRLGARRIWRGNAWFWDLKPDYKPGEVFEI